MEIVLQNRNLTKIITHNSLRFDQLLQIADELLNLNIQLTNFIAQIELFRS